MIETTGEYPQPQPAAVAVHPQTMMPLLNDGVGDDAGKVGKADDNTQEAGGVQSGYAPSPTSLASNEGGDEADSAGVKGDDVVQKMEEFFAAVLGKMSHVEHMVKKLLHRHH